MSIREQNAHIRKPFHLGSVQLLTVFIACEELIGTGVTYPHVVSHHEYYIWAITKLCKCKDWNKE